MSIVKFDSLLNCLLDVKVRYIPVTRTIYNWFRNRNINYTALSLDDVKNKYKRSDTVFILGGSDSINNITRDQWNHIAQHDSIGINWWPVHKFVPTYYYTNYPRNKTHFSYFQSVLGKNFKNYEKTIFFISGDRAVRRGIHPRILNRLFHESPLCCFYKYPKPINTMKFTSNTFNDSLSYRGGLSLVLDLMNKLQYKKIVLMGIDLKNRVHFYDTYPEMQWQFESGYSKPIELKKHEKHATQEAKGTRLPISKYLYALYDLYFKHRGIELYVGSTNSMLIDKIPLYSFPKKI